MDFSGFSDDDVGRWLWLRAVEWDGFPVFVSEPIAPVLFIFFRWYYVLLAVGVLGVLWCFVRYSFVNVVAATFASRLVLWLRWPAAICGSAFLALHHHLLAGTVAFLWPLLAGFFSIPGRVDVIEVEFARQVGYVPPPGDQ
jgi:hypothetical protein